MDTQIALLASQHHASQYNRAKFGSNGCPMHYVPLSYQLPEYFSQLRTRQLLNAQQQSWWPSNSEPTDLGDELRAAMEEPLVPVQPSPKLKTSQSHPINISSIIPPELLALISAHALLDNGAPTVLYVPSAFELHRLSTVAPPPLSVSLSVHIPSPEKLSSPDDWASLSILAPPQPSHSLPILLRNTLPPPSSTFTLGNLYLSSCPGKKVRLNGPVQGRSSVCRDLDTDIKRMKAMGTGCIVCCLDDAELDFLGAPWPEYEQIAKQNAIDVLRLPIPEGLPPLTAPHLDAHLLDLITNYTLRGAPVLVHCRGGVGRAGVVACCWLIRLGLCGWIDFSHDEPQHSIHPMLSFVERVISYVRSRRSMKAVETYEQVQFLVDYVNYLQQGSTMLSS